MRVLVLWADDSSTNLGVRALAAGTAALVRSVWPGAEIAWQSFGRGAAPVPISTDRALVREWLTRRGGLAAWLRGFDLVVDTRAGDSFADLYGARRLRTMTALASSAVAAGVPVVLGPQTIGPFDTRQGRLVGRFALRQAAAVMARDSESARCAAQLGRPVDVRTTDVVFALDAPVVERTRDVVLNVSGLLWRESPHTDAAAYRAVVDTVARRLLADGRRVTLLAHVLGSSGPDDDVPAVREVADRLGDVDVVVPADLDEVREVVGSARIVLGSRMHACLNALSMGTPAVPLAYSRKFAPLLADLGWEATVDLRHDPDPAAAALALVDDPSLEERVADVRRRADAALDEARAVLRSVV